MTRAPSATSNRGGVSAGILGSEVVRVDDPAPRRDLEALARDPRDEGAVAEVVAAREEVDPARAEHPVGEHLFVVGADGRLVGPLVQARLGTGPLDPTPAQHGRRDAVEGRGLVQPHERIGLAPVAPDTLPAVDERDPDVGVVDQRVGERHAGGAGPDHQVVGLHGVRHAATTAQPRRDVHRCRSDERSAREAWPLSLSCAVRGSFVQ